MPRRNHFRSTQRKRYESRTYKNPLISDRTQWNWKAFIVPSAVVSLLLVMTWVLFTHQTFLVRTVDVKGIQYIDRSMFEDTVLSYIDSHWLFFSRQNQFLLEQDVIEQRLTSQFALANISSSLKETTLHIELEERTSNLFWRTSGSLYVVDLQGVVVREVVSDEDDLLQAPIVDELPVFIDRNNVQVSVGGSVMTDLEVENAFLFFDALDELSIGQSYVEIDRLAGKWVRIVTDQEYAILFDMSGDIAGQVGNLRTVLVDQVEDPSTLEYIDLRFGDRVYFK